MANLIRPATERRVQRLNSSRSPPAAPPSAASPSASSIFEVEHDENKSSLRHTATRRTSRNPSLLPPHDDVIPQNTTATATTPPRSSRKRPASAIEDATTDARPPTKVTVTQPHGELFRITNGVPTSLGIGADDVPSGLSTPTASGAVPPRLAAPAQTSQQTGTPSTDKRSLRSHDGGSRLKSDLATYFSGYDDIIAGVEKSPEFLGVDARIYIVDEPIKAAKASQEPSLSGSSRKSVSPSRSRKARTQTPTRRSSVTSIPQPSRSPTSYQEIDYSSIANTLTDTDDDPLADSVYFAQHRRAERKEKQLRNIEKERAMHEKVQLERLLDGLQGPDWLKVMGISGVTDGEKKDWEPKRDYFIKEVEALVDKFRLWKEQEKRVRAEKEAALAKEEEEEEESSEPDNDHAPKKPNGKHAHNSTTIPPSTTTSSTSTPHTNTTTKPISPPKPRRPPRPHGFFLPLPPAEPKGPFTSFYAKPHLRAAALGKHRHHGRNASAFGHPLPDWEEKEFHLPEDFVSEEFMRGHARERRRRKRESVGGSGAGKKVGRSGGAGGAGGGE
ncbi:hypothetical protein DM02DRAFT_608181 [Periconia macrospinosa]|uniref:Something about silencing protein 4 domain-containing protein n=1 Tax=Periconia macrospinosa TaxID=97972 RepID=A0A2V1ECM6_9PLEO|nr:hypothetical protein DM02DRAFT_608181 [Periconia macrospinosa]